MKQRDQNRDQQRSEDMRNQRQGRYGAMPESGSDRQRQWRSQFTDTYNPEPQWLREDTPRPRYGQPLGGGDYDRDDEEDRSSRYAGARPETGGYRDRGYGPLQGRQYGARQQRSGVGGRSMGYEAMGYERDYDPDYDRGYDQGRGYRQRMAAGWDEDRPDAGQQRGGYVGDERFGHGASRHAGDYRESAHPGRDYSRDYGSGQFGSRSGQQFVSDYGSGGYDQVSGSYGYRGRGGFATGDYQSGMEGQRSYRGLGPQTYKRSDDRIRDDVCERLTDDARIDASNITIDVNQGAVTLSGSVPERYMRYAAEDLVDDALGVESINNQLHVQSGGSGTTAMASGSRATAASEVEKQKH